MSSSPAAFLASLPAARRTILLGTLSPSEHARLAVYWPFWARPEQIPPEGDWFTWLYLAGRGAGKTRSGAEWIREQVRLGRKRIAFVGPTAGDVRDTMIEGVSGILSVCQPDDVDVEGERAGAPHYEPSNRRLTWENGAIAQLFSAEEPERLRGPQFECAWADEMAAWKKRAETWDMLMFTLRLGGRPQVAVTTTPKTFPLLQEIMNDPRTVISTGSTYDNVANLSAKFLQRMRDKYEGTTLGQQELHAKILGEAEGALWSRKLINDNRCSEPPEYERIVVSVDPATTKNKNSDEHGIVVVARSRDIAYVLEDASGRMTPNEMGRTAIRLYRKWSADRIVAETNQGGDMVETILRNIDRDVAYRAVWASEGKKARAEPVAALYEQGRVKHVGVHEKLEDQMVSWEPQSGDRSPDRLDALVWGVTDQLLTSGYDALAGV